MIKNCTCEIHKNGKYKHWICGKYDPEKRKKIYKSNYKICKCGNKHCQFSKECKKCSSKKLWKGDNASYSAKHKWLQRNVKKPKECQKCGKIRKLEWSNISGKYKRDLTDWIAVCVPCHRKIDDNLPPIQTKEYRQTYIKKCSII